MPTDVTHESLIAEAEEVRDLAMQAGDFETALAAIREKAVIAGLRVERVENVGYPEAEG